MAFLGGPMFERDSAEMRSVSGKEGAHLAESIEHFTPRPDDGDFVFLHRVEDEIKARGFSIGPLQRGDPRGIMPSEYEVAKWRNLSVDDKRELHGMMTFAGQPRNASSIFVTWKVKP